MTDQILNIALGHIPVQLRDALISEFVAIESRFSRMDWGPAELNGGRFAEVVLRFLEWRESQGNFTPIGTALNRQKVLNQVRRNPAVPDGLRLHVSACCELLMDIRNRRDVAHLGDVIDVDEMDAHLVMRLVAWSLAEIIREESGIPPMEVQSIITRLSVRRLPLVEEVAGKLIVVSTNLKAKDKALVALYSAYPKPIEINTLRNAVNYGNASRFKQILLNQQKVGIAYVDDEIVHITKKGVAWVESNIDLTLEV